MSIFSQIFHLFNHWILIASSTISAFSSSMQKNKFSHESVPEAPMPSWPTFPALMVPLFLWTESHDIYASFLLDGFPTSPPHSCASLFAYFTETCIGHRCLFLLWILHSDNTYPTPQILDAVLLIRSKPIYYSNRPPLLNFCTLIVLLKLSLCVEWYNPYSLKNYIIISQSCVFFKIKHLAKEASTVTLQSTSVINIISSVLNLCRKSK